MARFYMFTGMRLFLSSWYPWADPEGGARGPDPTPHEKSQKCRVSLQYWSGSYENHKATKPAFNIGPFIAVFRSYIPSSPKKVIKFGPPLKNFLGPRMVSFILSDLWSVNWMEHVCWSLF